MAIKYVYSGAAGAGTGADWANAYTTLQAAITANAAGDTYYVAHDHAETAAANTTITFKGTAAAWDKVICVDRGGSVPPVLADRRDTASITTTGGSNLTIGGAGQYARIVGVIFNAGSGAANNQLMLSLGHGVFENCQLNKLGTNSSSNAITFGTNGTQNPSVLRLINTKVKFGNTGDGMTLRGCKLIWLNTASAIQGATLPTTLFQASVTSTATAELDGVDLSALGSGATVVGAIPASQSFRLTNCKTGASATVQASQTTAGGCQTDFIVSDSGATGYRQERYNYSGTLTAETTILRTGGASDGVQAISWKVTTTANVSAPSAFECFPIAINNTVVGSPVTLTIPIVNDGTTLTNAEVWVEVEYLGSSSQPLASVVSSGLSDILAVATNVTSDTTSTWTTTGLTTPVKQKLQVTFTPQMAGLVRAVVKFARASKTVYVGLPVPSDLA